MLRIPYRSKLRLKKIFHGLLISVAVLFVGAVLALIYADSMIRYDRNGAVLVGKAVAEAETQAPTEPRPQIDNPVIVLQEKEADTVQIKDMNGVYITTKMLKDIPAVTELMAQITEPCAVYMELKSVFGNYYYSSSFAFGNYPEDVDVVAVDALIGELVERGFYLVASIPAFPDRAYILENESISLRKYGGYSWMDSRGCYWLDPANDASVTRLMQMALDLGEMGFREVCFSEFKFPEGDSYHYDSDLPKEQVIRNGVEKLTALMAGSDILISFLVEGTEFPSDVAAGRIYVADIDGTQADKYAKSYEERSGAKEVVFLTSSKDERFRERAVLKPLTGE